MITTIHKASYIVHYSQAICSFCKEKVTQVLSPTINKLLEKHNGSPEAIYSGDHISDKMTILSFFGISDCFFLIACFSS